MATEVKINIADAPGHSEIKIFRLNGEIDESNLEALEKTLNPLAQQAAVKTIILNLKELTYVNSKVIGYLASFYTKLSENNQKLIFSEANSNIMDILSLVGLTNIVQYFETEDEAINASVVD